MAADRGLQETGSMARHLGLGGKGDVPAASAEEAREASRLTAQTASFAPGAVTCTRGLRC